MQPFQAHHPAVATDFEIKTALLNLMPKFHGLPAQEPIKHLRDFQAACSTVRRDGADETSILLKAFPFSLEGKVREWYYTQPLANVSNWDTLRKEFLEKFFPSEVTDKLRKDISTIVQDDNETLFEYWERFNSLLEACPHHMIDKIVLLSYITQGMRPQDKTTLESASNGSMKKYKTTDEAWQLISDLAESTRNHRQKQGRSKAVAEVSSSRETTALAQSICEMTNLLKQMQLNQQQVQQAQPSPAQQSQQLEDNMVASTHNFYDRPNQGYNPGGNNNHGWQDNSNQNWRDNNNRGGRDNQENQRWNNNNNRQKNQPYRAPHLRQSQGP
ncbi:hypothetical protein HN51_050682 [Arachis hypogaea]